VVLWAEAKEEECQGNDTAKNRSFTPCGKSKGARRSAKFVGRWGYRSKRFTAGGGDTPGWDCTPGLIGWLSAADLSASLVLPTCSLWSAIVGVSSRLLKHKSILGYTSSRHGFQPIQFTEYFLPSFWIFLGCESLPEVRVIGKHVPTQSVRDGFAARLA
jgi:hypothetical protein